MAITTMDKDAARTLSERTQEALSTLAHDLGLTVEIRGGSFDPTAGTYKPSITFKLANSAEQEFRGYAEMFGLLPDDYGTEFKSGAKTFRISGLATRSSKRPILATAADGKTYKFQTVAVKLALGRHVEDWERMA